MTANDNSKGSANSRIAIDLAPHDDRVSLLTSIKRFFSDSKSSRLPLRAYLKFTFVDIRASRMSYALNFLAVFFVVFCSVVMLSTLAILPILFLRLGETSNGMNDLIITPGGELEGAPFLNYYAIETIFPQNDSLRGYHAPRITFMTEVINTVLCDEAKDLYDMWDNPRDAYFPKGCSPNELDTFLVSAKLVVLDSERERRMEFGTAWNVPKLRVGEVILSRSVAIAANNTKVGDTVLIYVDTELLLDGLFLQLNESHVALPSAMLMKVVGIVGADFRKIDVDDFVVMEYEHIFTALAKGFYRMTGEVKSMAIESMDPSCCASSVHFNVNPSLRLEMYRSTEYTVVRRRISSWVSSIVHTLGVHQLSVNTPIVTFLVSVKFFSLFVQLIVSLILFGLAFLSLVLIYSLLNLSVERRVYETGIRRMIGFTREHLVFMLLTNVYFFAIPAWVTGLVVGQLVYMLLRLAIGRIIHADLPHVISVDAIVCATSLGLLLPLVGAILPISFLLANSLPKALSTTRGRNVGVKYKVVHASDTRKVNYKLLLVGAVLALFGFVIYFFFIMAVVQMRLKVLFSLLFAVLIGVLVGLVILALNFERLLQACVLYVFFFWERAAVFQAVKSFLTAHGQRNRKTTMIYAFSLGLTLFVAIAFHVQLTSFHYNVRRQMGAEVTIYFRSFNLIDLGRLAAYIKLSVPGVTGIAYACRSILHDLPVKNVDLSSLGRFSVVRTKGVRAVSPNFLSVIDPNFLNVYKHDELSSRYGISMALYTDERDRVVVPTAAYKSLHSESISDPMLLAVTTIQNYSMETKENRNFVVRPTAVLSGVAQLSMSEFKPAPVDILSSYPSAARFTGMNFLGIRAISVQTVSLRVPDPDNINSVSSLVKQYLTTKLLVEGVTVRVEETLLGALQTADRMIGFFSLFTLFVVLLICSASLFGSMGANVLESAKEIGIYRCIGMVKPQIYRVFMWEAFVIVISGSIIGLIIGIIVGYGMQLQIYLFTQLSLPFSFPYLHLAVIFIMAVVAAVASSIGPVSFLMNLPSITHILRRVV